jgi:hypothetical protein
MWLLMAEAPALVPAMIEPLVAAGHEDPCRLCQQPRQCGIVRLFPGDRSQADDVGDAELAEERLVQVGGLVTQRRRRRDDRHPPRCAAREGGEPRQDLPLPELLLSAADDQQVTWAGGARA